MQVLLHLCFPIAVHASHYHHSSVYDPNQGVTHLTLTLTLTLTLGLTLTLSLVK